MLTSHQCANNLLKRLLAQLANNRRSNDPAEAGGHSETGLPCKAHTHPLRYE